MVPGYPELPSIPEDQSPEVELPTSSADFNVTYLAEYLQKKRSPETVLGAVETREVEIAPEHHHEQAVRKAHDAAVFFAERLADPEKEQRQLWLQQNIEYVGLREADLDEHREYALKNIHFSWGKFGREIAGLKPKSYHYNHRFTSSSPFTESEIGLSDLINNESEAVIRGAELFGFKPDSVECGFANTKSGEWFYHEEANEMGVERHEKVFYVIKSGLVERHGDKKHHILDVDNEADRTELANFFSATATYHDYVSREVYSRQPIDVTRGKAA